MSSDSVTVEVNRMVSEVAPDLPQPTDEGAGLEDKAKTLLGKIRPRQEYGTVDYYWRQNMDYLQLSHMTSEERFPLIFDSAKKLKPDAKRILSFGCSTGEEVQALAKRFPDAEIVGVDIDYSSISAARKKNKNPNCFFHTDIGATGKYDLVIALMVFFCMEKPIPKDRWEKLLRKLDPPLNADGVLMIYTSDYDPKEVLGDNYSGLNCWKRIHNKNEKEYYNGYYKKNQYIPLPEPILIDPQPVVSDAALPISDAALAAG